MCWCKCCISAKSMHSSLLSWRGSFLKNLNIKAVIYKTEGLVNFKIVYFRHIKILSCHMEIICFQQHITLWWQQCVNIHPQDIHYHIGNLFCGVVRNVHRWIFQFQNQISTNQLLAPPYYFMSMNTYHAVLCMVDSLSMKINSVNFVRIIYIIFWLKTFIPENNLSW